MVSDRLQHQRYELKYHVTETKALRIRDFVQGHLKVDEYSALQPGLSYPALSLYLDSDGLDTHWHTINGNRNRYKLRLRYYDDQPGTPVFFEDRVYVTIGQDSRHGPGKGALTAIDATREGDVSATGLLWRYQGINRSFSTPSIAGGLLFVADYPGNIHCLDARTGQVHWVHRTGGTTMGSTLVADGKVYFGNDKGKLVVMAASKEERVISEVDLRSPIDCTPVVAGGVLYIAAHNWLYAAVK